MHAEETVRHARFQGRRERLRDQDCAARELAAAVRRVATGGAYVSASLAVSVRP
jgi:DNA-binding NarL/FixJ family response regulator